MRGQKYVRKPGPRSSMFGESHNPHAKHGIVIDKR